MTLSVAKAASNNGSKKPDKLLGFIAGLSMWSFMTIFVLIRAIFMIYLSNYIIDHTSPEATSFSELSQNVQYAIYVWAIVTVYWIIKSLFNKNEDKGAFII
jgi:hypothetical protein